MNTKLTEDEHTNDAIKNRLEKGSNFRLIGRVFRDIGKEARNDGAIAMAILEERYASEARQRFWLTITVSIIVGFGAAVLGAVVSKYSL